MRNIGVIVNLSPSYNSIATSSLYIVYPALCAASQGTGLISNLFRPSSARFALKWYTIMGTCMCEACQTSILYR